MHITATHPLEVINGSFEKGLRLVISYGSLKRNQFLDALQERLEPRLKKVSMAITETSV